MKNNSLAYLAIPAAMLLAACESEVTEVSQGDGNTIEVVATIKDLPKCNDKNEGVQVVVKGESTVRMCVDGDWSESGAVEDRPDTVFVDKDVSCKTEELKDKSGYRIVCNGDSVGVVLNETEEVKDTVYVDKDASCTTEELADSSGLKIVCNGDSVGVVLNDTEVGRDTVFVDSDVSCATEELADSSGLKIVCNGDSVGFVPYFLAVDTTAVEGDPDTIPIAIDSLSGYAQKGPFTGGSQVYLYELSDGHSLSQTGVNYVSEINRSYRYKFSALKLPCPYAMVIADGTYNNEVTGKTSTAPIRLRAISDLRKHATANVNILTHLEFNRVEALVTSGKMTVAQAKKQAQTELLSAFHFDPNGLAGFAEDLNVFGKTDADAALLAISVLLLSNLDEGDFSELLTALSSDMETDGVWDDAKTKVRIAEWAMKAEMSGLLKTVRSNVEAFNLSTSVPEFEKYVRTFWQTELGVGACGRSNDGETVDVKNELSSVKSLECNDGAWKFIAMRDLRDKQTYKVVKIGEQVWTAENIRYKSNSYYYPDGNAANESAYGLLYDWNTAKRICPNGWHLPTQEEWHNLMNEIDVKNEVTGKKLKSAKYWDGSDDYGFAALPAGYWDGDEYFGLGNGTSFWSSTEVVQGLSANALSLRSEFDGASLGHQSIGEPASVRCLQDN